MSIHQRSFVLTKNKQKHRKQNENIKNIFLGNQTRRRMIYNGK